MRVCSVVVVVAVAVAVVASAVPHAADDEFTLVRAFALFRHGDRTPLKPLPGTLEPTWKCVENYLRVYDEGFDALVTPPPPRVSRVLAQPGFNDLPGTCRAGQLTDAGFAQASALGAWLRQRYVNDTRLLAPTLTPAQLFVRSDDVSRCLATAEGVLAGLYPAPSPGGGSTQAVSVYVRDESKEDLTLELSHCPAAAEAVAKLTARSGPLLARVAALLLPMEGRIRKALNVSDPLDILEYIDTLKCHAAHGIPMPAPLTDADLTTLRAVYDDIGSVLFNATTFSMGPFYAALVGAMRSNVYAPLLTLFSGHDTSVGPMLAALQSAAVNQWPQYAANVVFEVWDSTADKSRHVSVLYNGAPLPLACASPLRCTIDEFAALLAPSTPADHDAACRLKLLRAPPRHAPAPWAARMLRTRAADSAPRHGDSAAPWW